MFRFGRLAMLVVVLSCCGCTTIPGDADTVEVLVKGSAATVSAFDQALQPTLKGYVVGCARCSDLGTTDSVTYSFYRSQAELYERFGTAWNAVVPGVGETKPAMTFFSLAIALDCSSKPLCYNLAPCVQYARCSSDASLHSCKACSP